MKVLQGVLVLLALAVGVNAQVGLVTTTAPSYHGWEIYNSAAQATNTGADTLLKFNSKVQDTDTFHVSDPNSRVTIPAGLGGAYAVTCGFELAASSSYAVVYGSLKLNGSTVISYTSCQIANGLLDPECTVSVVRKFSANDYIECHSFSNGVTTPNVNAVSEYSPYFRGVLVGQ
jgi:hypothetical protein